MISKGYKKYLRQEKARIRRQIIDQEEQKKLIAQLYPQELKRKTKNPAQKTS